MTPVNPRQFRADRSWGSRLLMDLDRYTVRIHWTETPYHWHMNSGEELFVVLDGEVRMHVADADGRETVHPLSPGDGMHFGEGDRHFAEPVGEVRVLVVEERGSE